MYIRSYIIIPAMALIFVVACGDDEEDTSVLLTPLDGKWGLVHIECDGKVETKGLNSFLRSGELAMEAIYSEKSPERVWKNANCVATTPMEMEYHRPLNSETNGFVEFVDLPTTCEGACDSPPEKKACKAQGGESYSVEFEVLQENIKIALPPSDEVTDPCFADWKKRVYFVLKPM